MAFPLPARITMGNEWTAAVTVPAPLADDPAAGRLALQGLMDDALADLAALGYERDPLRPATLGTADADPGRRYWLAVPFRRTEATCTG